MGFNQILPRIVGGRMESDKHGPMRWSPINTVEHVKPNKHKPKDKAGPILPNFSPLFRPGLL